MTRKKFRINWPNTLSAIAASCLFAAFVYWAVTQ